MHCEKAEMLLPLLVFDEIDDGEKVELMSHLSECSACSEKLGDLRVTMNLLREGFAAAPLQVLSAERKTKLMKKLAKPPKRGKGKKKKATTFAGLPLSWFTPSQWKFRLRPLHVAAGLAIATGLTAMLVNTATESPMRASPQKESAELPEPPVMAITERGDRAAFKSNEWRESSPTNRYNSLGPNPESTRLSLHDGRRSGGSGGGGAPGNAPNTNWELDDANNETTAPTGDRLALAQLESRSEKNLSFKYQNAPADFDSDTTITNGTTRVPLGNRADQFGSARFNAPLPPPMITDSSGPDSPTTNWYDGPGSKQEKEQKLAERDEEGWKRSDDKTRPATDLAAITGGRVADGGSAIAPATRAPARPTAPATPSPKLLMKGDSSSGILLDDFSDVDRPVVPTPILPPTSGPAALPRPTSDAKPATSSTSKSLEDNRPVDPAAPGVVLNIQGGTPVDGVESYFRKEPSPAVTKPAGPGVAFEQRAKDALDPSAGEKRIAMDELTHRDGELHNTPQRPGSDRQSITQPTGEAEAKSNLEPDDSLAPLIDSKKKFATDDLSLSREDVQRNQTGKASVVPGEDATKWSGARGLRERELRQVLEGESGYLERGKDKIESESTLDRAPLALFGRDGQKGEAKKLEEIITNPHNGKEGQDITKGLKELADRETEEALFGDVVGNAKPSEPTLGGVVRFYESQDGVIEDTQITLKSNDYLRAGKTSPGDLLEMIESLRADIEGIDSRQASLAPSANTRVLTLDDLVPPLEGEESSAIALGERAAKAREMTVQLKAEVDDLRSAGTVQTAKITDHNGVLIVQGNAQEQQLVTQRLTALQQSQLAAAGKGVRPQSDSTSDGGELQPAANFRIVPVNPWTLTQADAQSTFALDVDTASYTLGRRYIQRGYLPPAGSVRMEEYINAFDYNYVNNSSDVFRIHVDGAPAPFAPTGEASTKLVKIGVKGKVIGRDGRKPANLVLVVDTSGSMARPDRLPLIQHALELLIDQLSEHDTVSLVTFGSDVLTHLAATPASNKDAIRTAINALQANGPTNLLKGVQAGYKLAEQAHKSGSINRVIVCSDGIATLGETEADAILTYVENYRKQGISCTAIGFGAGAYDDDMMEKLANKGDGTYHFVDSKREARKVFVDDLTATLQTIAKDAKIQVEFNKDRVRRYRLIGYENRAVADKDFRNDTIDAGEVGSGQSSTALYEVELIGDQHADIGTVYVRYRNADTEKIEEISQRLTSALIRERSPKEDPRFFLAACAAEFAELLRSSEHATDGNLAKLQALLEQTVPHLPLDEKAAELLDLVRKAQGLPRAP